MNFAVIDDPSLASEIGAFKEYGRLVKRDEAAFYYQTPQYLKMLRSIVGDKIILFSAFDNGKMIMAYPVLVKHSILGEVMNALPYFGSNSGIVLDPDYQGRINILRDWFSECFWGYINKSKYVALTIIDSLYSERCIHLQGRDIQSYRTGMMTPIANGNTLLARFHQKNRNVIVKARKNGVRMIHCVGHISRCKAIDIIQSIHIRNMEGIGASVKPEKFFTWLKGDPMGLNVYLAIHEGNAAAGLITLRHNEVVEYYTPAIDKEYRHLAPLNALIFEAMLHQSELGSKYWNWGGTALSGMEGVYRFKRRFDAAETKYTYHSFVYNQDLFKLSPDELKMMFPYYFVYPYKTREEVKDGESGN